MKPRLAITETEREQSRLLINRVFPERQPILRKDRELISTKNRDSIFFGEGKELIILGNDNVILGTAILGMDNDAAYVIYLTKDPDLPKGAGKLLMTFAENRAKNVHHKKIMRVSIVYHPKCTQKRLEDWYTKELGFKFYAKQNATPDQQLDWEPEYLPNTYFKFFEKNLD